MLLYYIRHGDPVYDPDSLTPLGQRQAEAVAHRLAAHGMDRIYASTSKRAHDTAVPLAEMLKQEIIDLDFMNEKYSWGFFTAEDSDGKRRWAEEIPEYRRLFVSDEMYSLGHCWYEHPGLKNGKFKEGAEFYGSHADEFMLSLGYRHDGSTHTYEQVAQSPRRVALFAHGGSGAFFLSRLLDIPYPQLSTRISMSHTGVTVIEFKDGEGVIPRLCQFGSDSHLYRDGLPTRHCNRIYI